MKLEKIIISLLVTVFINTVSFAQHFAGDITWHYKTTVEQESIDKALESLTGKTFVIPDDTRKKLDFVSHDAGYLYPIRMEHNAPVVYESYAIKITQRDLQRLQLTVTTHLENYDFCEQPEKNMKLQQLSSISVTLSDLRIISPEKVERFNIPTDQYEVVTGVEGVKIARNNLKNDVYFSKKPYYERVEDYNTLKKFLQEYGADVPVTTANFEKYLKNGVLSIQEIASLNKGLYAITCYDADANKPQLIQFVLVKENPPYIITTRKPTDCASKSSEPKKHVLTDEQLEKEVNKRVQEKVLQDSLEQVRKEAADQAFKDSVDAEIKRREQEEKDSLKNLQTKQPVSPEHDRPNLFISASLGGNLPHNDFDSKIAAGIGIGGFLLDSTGLFSTLGAGFEYVYGNHSWSGSVQEPMEYPFTGSSSLSNEGYYNGLRFVVLIRPTSDNFMFHFKIGSDNYTVTQTSKTTITNALTTDIIENTNTIDITRKVNIIGAGLDYKVMPKLYLGFSLEVGRSTNGWDFGQTIDFDESPHMLPIVDSDDSFGLQKVLLRAVIPLQ